MDTPLPLLSSSLGAFFDLTLPPGCSELFTSYNETSLITDSFKERNPVLPVQKYGDGESQCPTPTTSFLYQSPLRKSRRIHLTLPRQTTAARDIDPSFRKELAPRPTVVSFTRLNINHKVTNLPSREITLRSSVHWFEFRQ